MKPNERYIKLEKHLALENPVLLDIINIYRELDEYGYKFGLLNKTESFATHISWWPLISVLGTFSAGKSSFINQYTDQPIQNTGNQAVDDKFTVICYGSHDDVNTLPGVALDSDPRFPFFGISEEIEKVESGEGNRIDSYLQLKTAKSDILKGKILIDSPGFDADSQRDATLRITDHIIDMSDLVLVFFDARHPEPGAMRDTLEHLVATTVGRNDSDKILFILNQIDTAAQEDNPEEVISSWQRAIAQEGLIAGNFYSIYNEASAVKIEDAALEQRFKRKKDQDLERILERMDKVSTERTYRIAQNVEYLITEIEEKKIPLINQAITSWRNKVIAMDLLVIGGIAAALGWASSQYPELHSQFTNWMNTDINNGIATAIIAIVVTFGIHFTFKNKLGKWDAKRLEKTRPDIANALSYNNRFWRGMFHKHPRGWSKRNRRGLERIVKASKNAIQKLTDQFVDPSGKSNEPAQTLSEPKVSPSIESVTENKEAASSK